MALLLVSVALHVAKGLDVEEVVLASAGAVWLGLHRDPSRSGEPLAFLRGRCVRACVELSAFDLLPVSGFLATAQRESDVFEDNAVQEATGGRAVIGVAEQLAVEPVLPDRVRLRQIHEPGDLRAS